MPAFQRRALFHNKKGNLFMTLSYRFKVMAMSYDELVKEALTVAELGDMEKLKCLNHKDRYAVRQAVMTAARDLPEATCFVVNQQKYTEMGKYLTVWYLTTGEYNKFKTVKALIENGITMNQHMKDSLLANALEVSGGNAHAQMAEVLLQKGADLEAATALMEHRYVSDTDRLLDAVQDSPVSNQTHQLNLPQHQTKPYPRALRR
jgi:hypothetical protein